MSVTFSAGIAITSGNGRRRVMSNINTDLNGEVTLAELLEFTKSTLIIAADELLKEEQAKGFDPTPVMLVDGRPNKPLAAVHPLGKIQFIARADFTEILSYAYTALLELSKVQTGRYKASHRVFHNGRQVAVDLASLNAWIASDPEIKDADKIRIVNIQPYARRLELLGVAAGRTAPKKQDKGRRKGQVTGKIFSVPNGAYQLAHRRISNKYKANARILFRFIPGSQLGLTGTFGKQWGKGRAGRPYLYPSLVFHFQQRGSL